MAADDFDDVPPLEDMTDQIAAMRGVRPSPEPVPSNTRQAIDATSTATTVNAAAPAPATAVAPSAAAATATATGKGSFGGMKKGFFDAKPKKAAPSAQSQRAPAPAKEEMIEIVTPKVAKEEALRLKEVQDAMDAGVAGVGGNEWMNASLMARIAKRPSLARRLADPRYSAALSEMQKNPRECVERLKDDPDMDSFLREFSEVMGAHFEELADEQEAALKRKEAEEAAKREEARKQAMADPNVRRVMDSPELKALLMDPEVVNLFERLRTDPRSAEEAIRRGGPAMAVKVKRLVDAGLLAFQA